MKVNLLKLQDGTLQPEDIIKCNFLWAVDIEYDNDYDCDNYGCNDEGICRCSTIINVKIKMPNVSDLVEELFKKVKNEPLLKYCTDRLLRQFVKSKDDFDVQIGRGYYGQEVNGIFLNNQGQFVKEFEEIKNATTITDRLNLVLKKEYGYLLPKMENFKYEVRDCNLENIKIPNLDYMRRIDAEKVKKYEEEILKMDYPFGVCEEDGSGALVLIDGYHRYLACKNFGQNKVEMFVGKQ